MGRAMKDSGVEWIGEIPEDWTCCKQKYVLTLINGRAYKDTEFETDGKYKVLRVGNLFTNGTWYTSSLELEEDKYCDNGDLLYAWSASYGPYIWNGEKVIYHYHIWKVALNSDIYKHFAYYYLFALSNNISSIAHGTAMQHVTMELMNNSFVAYPSYETQRAIARCIDEKCAEIDVLLNKTRTSIEEYKHLKQAVITRAVTKGIRQNTSLRYSDVIWLDTIPSHWRMSKIKYEIHPLNRKVLEDDEIITCFRDGTVTLRKNRREDGFTISLTENGYQGVEVGDLVVHGMDAFAGSIGCSDSRGKTTPVVHVCSTTGNNRFFMYFLRGMAYSNVFMDFSNGIRIRSSDFRNFARLGVFDICVPPIDEQNEIAAYLDEKCAEIDALIAKKEQLLTELESYKKSLIYEYVTGKKEAAP